MKYVKLTDIFSAEASRLSSSTWPGAALGGAKLSGDDGVGHEGDEARPVADIDVNGGAIGRVRSDGWAASLLKY